MNVRCDNCLEEYDDASESCPHCGHVPGAPAEELLYLDPGATLNGRYAVGRVLGFGGFGIIYKAWDKKTSAVVAIKEFYPSGLVNRTPGTKAVKLVARGRAEEYEESKRRFKIEAEYLYGLSYCEGTIRVTDMFEENGTLYMVMEHLEESLEKRLAADGPMGWEDGVNMILQICDALKVVHSTGVLHRDIGPDNIMFSSDGAVKLIDFGAAKFFKDESESSATRVMKPGYSPPEQYVQGSAQGEWTDIYALGATLYNAVTGMKPEESTNRKTEDNLPTPRALNREIPEDISDAILKAMAVDVRLRFDSVEEFEKALRRETKTLSPEKEIKKRKKKRFVSALIIAVVILTGAGGVAAELISQYIAGTLPDASVFLWYELTGDAERDAAKETAIKAIIGEFTGSYRNGENVKITPKGIDAADYAEEVEKALGGGTPVLFESGSLDPQTLQNAIDVSGVVKDAQKNYECYFLDRYARYFPAMKQVPLGFSVSVIYVNTTLSDYEKRGVGNLSELLTSMPANVSGVAVEDADIPRFERTYGQGFKTARSEQFFDGTVGAYFASSTEFFEVGKTMAGRYKLLYADGDVVTAEFESLWSISNCGSDEQLVAKKLLEYMLSGNAQARLHLLNRSGLLPINKNFLDEDYVDTYKDYDGFFENIDKYVFEAK
jgi:serine/threonine protein kinase